MLLRVSLAGLLLLGSVSVHAQSAPSAPQTAQGAPWLYGGSDIAPDPAWRFGTLPNGLRYAIRRNALPPGQVSIRLRLDVGALHEEADQQGWAHLVEHMAFRGTESFADRRAREIWQGLGASFGSDTNAMTTPTQTVYQLDLPKSDRESLDTSLHILAEMVSKAKFDPAAVEAERRIVTAEKDRRPELSQRMLEVSRQLFLSGLRIADRDTAGTPQTLAGASPEALKAFYQRWYRPDRATLVMVGDADPDMMEALLRRRFGDWQAVGAAPQDPDFGRPADPEQTVANLAYPGVPDTVQLMWLRPYVSRPHTQMRERETLTELLAERIINRRLEAEARSAEPPFISAAINASRSRAVADTTTLSIVAKDGKWREGTAAAYSILADALRTPPSAAEISRELQNIRASATAAVQGENTVSSAVRANQLINAVDSESVVASAATILANLERNAPAMTPQLVGADMRRLTEGLGPRMLLVSPAAVDRTVLASALEGAQAAAPATRRAERQVSFADLPALGSPGREISRQRIEDLGVTIVRFANGATLTHKKTEFERGTVQVRVRFGGGIRAMAPDQPSMGWLSGLIGPSGLADLDLDGVERLLTGRRMMLAFNMAEDGFVLSGTTNAAELGDQLLLMAVKMAYPRWDEALLARFKASALESFELHKSSAAARASRELAGVLRPGDARSRPVERDEIAAASLPAFRSHYGPLLGQGPVHATVVGDVDLDAAIAAMRGSVAALPTRSPAPTPAGSLALKLPAADPQPKRFTHDGDPSQAYALIGWSTIGGADRARDRRALAIAANIIRVRLFDRLREAEGVSYSPSAGHSTSDIFTDWGVLTAATELRPEHVPTFFRIAREVVADLAANPPAADEFARAQNPAVSGVERQLSTNAYWIGAAEDFAARPQAIVNTRTLLSDVASLTPADIQRVVATYVADQGDWSMVVLPARTAPPGMGRNGEQ